MKKIVLTFGLISGVALAAMSAITIPLCMNGVLPFESSLAIGYTTMVLAFSFVFFAIRSYRDNVSGGTITFGRAFKVGILVSLITCAVYVTSWEIVYYNFVPDFADKYSTLQLQRMREDGASDAKIAEEAKKLEEFKRLYANPFFNVGMTFMEVFPVGLILTLVSAAILRRKTTPDAPVGATAIA